MLSAHPAPPALPHLPYRSVVCLVLGMGLRALPTVSMRSTELHLQLYLLITVQQIDLMVPSLTTHPYPICIPHFLSEFTQLMAHTKV